MQGYSLGRPVIAYMSGIPQDTGCTSQHIDTFCANLTGLLQVEIDLSSLGIFSTAVAAVFSKLGVPIKTTVAPMVQSLSGADPSLSHFPSAQKHGLHSQGGS